MRIGIAGFGFVGQAVYASIKSIENENNVILYDKYKNMGDIETLKNSDCVFCCLPTPMGDGGKQEFTEYDELLGQLKDVNYGGIVIVKSTVLLGNLEKYCDDLNIVFNPEFLNQNNAVNDFSKQHVIILGGRMDHCKTVQDMYQNCFDLENVEFEFCTLKEAVEVKYMHNIYHAYKVLFWNFVHQQTGNHRKMFNLYSKITGNTNEMANVGSDGMLGYGGACFPKDVKAFHVERPHVLTEFMSKYNQALRGDVDEKI